MSLESSNPKKRGRPAKSIEGGSLPPAHTPLLATPSSGGHPRSSNHLPQSGLVGCYPLCGNAPEISTQRIQTTLKSAGIILIDCDHNTPKYLPSGKPYVCIPQLKGGRLELENVQRISESDFIQWTKKAKPTTNDVILSRRCNPGETAYVPDGLEIALGQNLVLLRATNPEILTPTFLRWLTQGPKWWEQVNQFINVGAVFTSLKCADIPKFEIDLPSIDDQKRIASILGSLDDKIALNRRMNQTLEAMAQALFQSWFVDFDPVKAKQAVLESSGSVQDAELAAMQAISGKSLEQLKAFHKQQPEQYAELEKTAKLFPNRLVESELGLVPEGWECVKIVEITQRIGSGGTPKKNEIEYWSPGVIPWLTSGEVRQTIITRVNSSISELGLSNSSAKWMPAGATVVAMYGATAGQVAYSAIKLTTNQAVCGLVPLEGFGCYLYFSLSARVDILANQATGSAQQNISKGLIEGLSVLKPTFEAISAFENNSQPVFSRWISNLHENDLLTSIRDSLLPKLLSGEIDVSALEIDK